MTTTVAILGTGKMGGAMARRLAASGFDLILWNRTAERAQELGIGRIAATPADATRDAEVVISSLTNETAVRDVYLGEDGALQTAAGKLLIDSSTAGPRVAAHLGPQAEARGARFLEAPVVGSVPAVESGTLLVIVAGDRSVLEDARPVLEHLGQIQYAGAWGNAQRLKLVANSMLAITSSAAAELLAAGTAAGVDRSQVFSVLTRFAPGLAARERGFLHDQHTPTMFAVRDLVKDLDLALETFRGTGVSMPITDQARERFAETLRRSPDLDISAVVTVYETS
jgi:3-hydroxyisobutyrate dehydrogenase-like beta-hydroxyacid dehydrogenase